MGQTFAGIGESLAGKSFRQKAQCETIAGRWQSFAGVCAAFAGM